jgi:hypothetical protein
LYLSHINTYPIKSTHPIALNSSYLFNTGVAYDRHWMLVGVDNAMLTSRKYPKLLHITSRIDAGSLVVEMPYGDFLLPLQPQPQQELLVQHWGDEPLTAWSQNPALDAALSAYLEMPCRLVYNASVGLGSGAQTAASFADAQPLLLTTSASLAALNQRLESPIGMDRFRTNLVVNNTVADIEDAWQKIRIGACELEVAYPCERCVLTTIDPVTLQRHPQQEPLRTLAQYRRLEGASVGFGINLTVIKGGMISLNDSVEILV